MRIEGRPQCDWVLIDAGDIIVHVFRPEVREFYNLEKMWSAERPSDPTHALDVIPVLVTGSIAPRAPRLLMAGYRGPSDQVRGRQAPV